MGRAHITIENMGPGVNYHEGAATKGDWSEWTELVNLVGADGDLVVRAGFAEFAQLQDGSSHNLRDDTHVPVLGMARYTFRGSEGTVARRLAVVMPNAAASAADLYFYNDDGTFRGTVALGWDTGGEGWSRVSMTVFDGKLLICNGSGVGGVDYPVMVWGTAVGETTDTYTYRVLSELPTPNTAMLTAASVTPNVASFDDDGGSPGDPEDWSSSGGGLTVDATGATAFDSGQGKELHLGIPGTGCEGYAAIGLFNGVTKNLKANENSDPNTNLWSVWFRVEGIAGGVGTTRSGFVIAFEVSEDGVSWTEVGRLDTAVSKNNEGKQMQFTMRNPLAGVEAADVDEVDRVRLRIVDIKDGATWDEQFDIYFDEWISSYELLAAGQDLEYCYLYRDEGSGRVSPASPSATAATTADGAMEITMQGMALPSVDAAGADKIVLYRRGSGEATFFKVTEVDNPGADEEVTFVDNVPSEEIVEPLSQYEFRAPPMTCTLVAAHGTRVIWMGSPEYARTMFLTDQGQAVVSRDIELGTVEYPDPSIGGYIRVGGETDFTINAAAHAGSVALLFGSNVIYGLYGSSFEDFQVRLLRTDLGAPGPHAVDAIENAVIFFHAGRDRSLWAWDGETFSELGFNVRPAFKDFTATMLGYLTVIYFDKMVFVLASQEQPEQRNEMYVFDLETRGWCQFQMDGTGVGATWSPYIAAACRAPDDPLRIYLGHAQRRAISYFPSAVLYDRFRGTNFAIGFEADTKHFNFAGPRGRLATWYPSEIGLVTNDGEAVFALDINSDFGRNSVGYSIEQSQTAEKVGRPLRPRKATMGRYVQLALSGEQPTDAAEALRLRRVDIEADVIR